MSIQQYAAGEIIIAEGMHGTQTFLIREGEVQICKETGRGTRIPLATLGPGEVFGEMYLFDDTGFRTASVFAKGNVLVEIIEKEEMDAYLAATPPVILSMIKTLSARLARTSQENSILKFKMRNPLNQFTRLFTRK